jgi:hypothetical protein
MMLAGPSSHNSTSIDPKALPKDGPRVDVDDSPVNSSDLDAIIYDKGETTQCGSINITADGGLNGPSPSAVGVDNSCPWLDDGRIGNNRIRCMVENHAKSFTRAILCNDHKEMDQIAQSIVDTFCHKCKMSSRLLEQRQRRDTIKDGEQEMTYYYIDLGDGPEAKARVLQALYATVAKMQTTQPDRPSKHEHMKKRRVLDSAADAAIHPSIRSASQALYDATYRQQSFPEHSLRKKRRTNSLESSGLSNNSLESSVHSKGKEGPSPSSQDFDLLIAAAGASSARASSADSYSSSTKRKKVAFGPGVKEGAPAARGVAFMDDDELDKFDVVITGPLGDAIENHDRCVGNNRLRVMASTRREAFASADAPTKRQMAIQLYDQLKNEFKPPGRIVVHRDHPALSSSDADAFTLQQPGGRGCGKWNEVDRETSIIILEKTLAAACRGLAEEKLKAPIEAIAKVDIDSVRSAAIASLEERRLRKNRQKEQLEDGTKGRKVISKKDTSTADSGRSQPPASVEIIDVEDK